MLSLALTILSLLPLPPYVLLGNAGEVIFGPLTPVFSVLATGVAWIMWGTIWGIVILVGEARKALATTP